DVDMSFDGKTLTLLGNNLNVYAQIDIPGSIDHLAHELREKHNRPLPAADLLMSDAYQALMEGVVDIKDLGSGVVGGVECDFLAFRAEEVDWQIWIAQGDDPYPCRYSIASKTVAGLPQYTVQLRNWKTGDAVKAIDFSFVNSTHAVKVEPGSVKDANELPEHFVTGESQ
ncbi:MAG: DUF2092 domain-containing protein, partial [Sedimenticolaceae bacterium]